MVQKLKTYLPYILAAALFFAGRFSAPQPDKELVRKLQLERNYHLNEIKDLQARVVQLDKAGQAIAEKMKVDSLKNSITLKENNEAYLMLKKQYEKIDYSRADVSELDSSRARIIALYTANRK